MTDQSAATIPEILLAGWVARFGVPDTIRTDQVRQFESQHFSNLVKLWGFESCEPQLTIRKLTEPLKDFTGNLSLLLSVMRQKNGPNLCE